MSLVSDLIPVVDNARKVIEQIGFRLNQVKLVTITWPDEPGIGIPTVTETLMDPLPKVLKYRIDRIINSGGAILETDLEISKISKTYTLDQLMGGVKPKNVEFFWGIDGTLYTPIGYQERPIGWNIQVRRTNRMIPGSA